jgi:hypothetical protein
MTLNPLLADRFKSDLGLPASSARDGRAFRDRR